jgi:hypothetical protein
MGFEATMPKIKTIFSERDPGPYAVYMYRFGVTLQTAVRHATLRAILHDIGQVLALEKLAELLRERGVGDATADIVRNDLEFFRQCAITEAIASGRLDPEEAEDAFPIPE